MTGALLRRWPAGRRLTLAASLATVALGAAALTSSGGAELPVLPVVGLDRPFPRQIVAVVNASVGPEPFSRRSASLDAYVALPGDRVFVFAAFGSAIRRCVLAYTAFAGSLRPERPNASQVQCMPSDSQLPFQPLNIVPAEVAGPLVLYGSAPARADRLALTTDAGRRLWFRLPGVPLHDAPGRQAVLLSLAPLGPESVIRADAAEGRRVLQSDTFLP
jgi:hypothetical protein